ncbi:MAG: sigma 54-interacting transcriptional regulator [Bernardetiaceae bacterium]|nr:sigma 54-interacting transcriptional regulator [Bernardetiaceae bacterium]
MATLNQPPGFAKLRQWLYAGAAEVLHLNDYETPEAAIAAIFQRWLAIEQALGSALVQKSLVGRSPVWRNALRQVAEAALLPDINILILGPSGTGKEAVAQLIHELSPQPQKGRLVTVDCTTLMPELAGSELFGHEKGAFTHALNTREGAIALANGGTLYLDEVGELPLLLQAELLRVIQEGVYKKVGSNHWQRSDFRLVCATNRNLWAEVEAGRFRLDLYFRIASRVCQLPALNERRTDIPHLVEHFLCKRLNLKEAPLFSPMLMELLQQRNYPGNVRELQQLVNKIADSYIGQGPVTIGCLPLHEIPPPLHKAKDDPAPINFLPLVTAALEMGWSLKDIKEAASDAAIELAIRRENGNLQNAAKSLAVTDRTLQLWRAAHQA